jgi:hypothetical protein
MSKNLFFFSFVPERRRQDKIKTIFISEEGRSQHTYHPQPFSIAPPFHFPFQIEKPRIPIKVSVQWNIHFRKKHNFPRKIANIVSFSLCA